MKSTKITAPEGYEIDRDKSTFDEIVFKEVKKEFAQSWEELGYVSGWWLLADMINHCPDPGPTTPNHRNIFATEAQAKSALAMAQLSQLMKEVHEGWVADWYARTKKYVITRHVNKLIGCCNDITYRFLAFETAEKRDNFLATHEALIRVYFQIEDTE